MAKLNTEMSVSGIGQFKQAMSQGKTAVKALDAELKLNAAQFKQSGKQEEYMKQRADILTRQIKEQEKVVDAAQKALEKMSEQGADKASSAYQNMQIQLMNAQTSLVDMQSSLADGTDAFKEGADAVDQYAEVLNHIDKRVSFQSALSGLSAVKSAISGISGAVNTVANTVKESAQYADDLNTSATKYNVDTDTLQAYKYAANFVDVDVDQMLTSMYKLSKLKQEGGMIKLNDSYGVAAGGDMLETYWNVLDALDAITNETEQAALAQDIFGKSWLDLRTLIGQRDTWAEKMQEGKDKGYILTTDELGALQETNDKLDELDNAWANLKHNLSVWATPIEDDLLDWTINAAGQTTSLVRGEQSFWDTLGNVVNFGQDSRTSAEKDQQKLQEIINALTNGTPLVQLLMAGYSQEEIEAAKEQMQSAAEANMQAMVAGVEGEAEAAYVAGAGIASQMIAGAVGSSMTTNYNTDSTYIDTVNITGGNADEMRDQINKATNQSRAGVGS